MTVPRQWFDRSEEQWVRAYKLDGMAEPAARRRAADLMDDVERARAAGARMFWDVGTVLPMACADPEIGRHILAMFEPALETTDEDDDELGPDDRAAAAESRAELAAQLGRIREFLARSGDHPDPAG